MKTNYGIKSSPRMFEQVAKQISEYIVSEHLQAGSKLPTERQLSELLEVSRSSVREGLRVLELLRFLDSKQGEGTFVSEPPPFLIPHRMVEQQLPLTSLRHYFDISLMCAENILRLSMEQNIQYDEPVKELSFWEHLNLFITEIGEKLDNPYYVSLWSASFDFVLQDGRLLNQSEPFELTALIHALNSADAEKVSQFIRAISSI